MIRAEKEKLKKEILINKESLSIPLCFFNVACIPLYLEVAFLVEARNIAELLLLGGCTSYRSSSSTVCVTELVDLLLTY